MIVITGESGSGKSTLQKLLVKHNKKLKKLVTYTTRPKRKGEHNNKDYHFVTEEQFEKLKEVNGFVEISEYNGWRYGTPIAECSDDDNVVAVLTPAGARQLIIHGFEVIWFYLEVDRRSRLIKILSRGDDIEEAYRRNLSDLGQFNCVKKEANITLVNPGYTFSTEEMEKEFYKILKEYYKLYPKEKGLNFPFPKNVKEDIDNE